MTKISNHSNRIDVIRKYFSAHNESDAKLITSLFIDDAEIFDAFQPLAKEKNGIMTFCEEFYSKTSKRDFQIIESAQNKDTVMVEWNLKMTIKTGAKLGSLEIATPFDVEYKGMSKFEFLPDGDLIKRLRIYQDTSIVSQKAKEHSKK